MKNSKQILSKNLRSADVDSISSKMKLTSRSGMRLFLLGLISIISVQIHGQEVFNQNVEITGEENSGTKAALTIQTKNNNQKMLIDGNEIDAVNDDTGDPDDVTHKLYLNNNSKFDVILANGGGNIGIGTDSPEARLHVFGQTLLEGAVEIGNESTDGFLSVSGVVEAKTALISRGGILAKGDIYLYATEGDGQDGIAYMRAGSTLGKKNVGLQLMSQNSNGNVEALKINPSGNIGIGTTDPQRSLHVLGQTLLEGGVEIGNESTYGALSVNGFVEAKTALISRDVILAKGDVYLYATEGDGQDGIAYMRAGSTLGQKNVGLQLMSQNSNGNVEALKINPSGYVGIGTSFPEARLHIEGDTYANGNIGIGTNNPLTPLHVVGNTLINGKVTSKEVEVTSNGWSDFVFEEGYELQSLEEVELFIQENQHLPDVPSEKEIVKDGINLGDMDAILLQKIEELTLYMIDLKKENNELRDVLENLQKSH